MKLLSRMRKWSSKTVFIDETLKHLHRAAIMYSIWFCDSQKLLILEGVLAGGSIIWHWRSWTNVSVIKEYRRYLLNGKHPGLHTLRERHC
jgi:hypothetical protein